MLGKLSADDRNPTTQQAAQRELDIRGAMEDISQDQVSQESSHGHRMRATQAVSPEGVDAMRFAQSLAQEASDHLKLKAADAPKMMGVAEVDGAIGVGFSGGSGQDAAKAQRLMDSMVELNAFAKKQEGLPTSTDFQAIPVPPVLPEVSAGSGDQPDRERVCAVHRATAAAMSMNGELSPHGPVDFRDLRTDIAAMETTHTPFSEKSGASLSSHFDPLAQVTPEPPNPYRQYKGKHLSLIHI